MVAVSLTDELYASAKHFAETHSIALEDAVSSLIREGLRATEIPTDRIVRGANGFYIFNNPADTPTMTVQELLAAETMSEEDEVRHWRP
jgi:hypothetical protein